MAAPPAPAPGAIPAPAPAPVPVNVRRGLKIALGSVAWLCVVGGTALGLHKLQENPKAMAYIKDRVKGVRNLIKGLTLGSAEPGKLELEVRGDGTNNVRFEIPEGARVSGCEKITTEDDEKWCIIGENGDPTLAIGFSEYTFAEILPVYCVPETSLCLADEAIFLQDQEGPSKPLRADQIRVQRVDSGFQLRPDDAQWECSTDDSSDLVLRPVSAEGEIDKDGERIKITTNEEGFYEFTPPEGVSEVGFYCNEDFSNPWVIDSDLRDVGMGKVAHFVPAKDAKKPKKGKKT